MQLRSYQSMTIRSLGYTLIELLIVIGITSVLITYGISAYRKSSERQQLKHETSLILSALTETQKEASTGKADCEGLYLGEQLTIIELSSTITIQSICELSSGTPKTITLNKSQFANSYSLIFKPLSQGIEFSTSGNLNLDYIFNTLTYRIVITPAGSINYLGAI